MDTLIEQVVPKAKNAGYGVKIALIILIAIAIPAIFIIIAKIAGIA